MSLRRSMIVAAIGLCLLLVSSSTVNASPGRDRHLVVVPAASCTAAASSVRGGAQLPQAQRAAANAAPFAVTPAAPPVTSQFDVTNSGIARFTGTLTFLSAYAF